MTLRYLRSVFKRLPPAFKLALAVLSRQIIRPSESLRDDAKDPIPLGEHSDVEQVDEAVTVLSDERQTDGTRQNASIQAGGTHEFQAGRQNRSMAIDLHVVERLARETTPKLVPEMMSVFAREVRNRLSDIHEAEVTGDGQRITKSTHAIKGSADTFGASQIKHAAQQLEALGKMDSEVDLGPKIRELENAINTFDIAFRKFLANYKPKNTLIKPAI